MIVSSSRVLLIFLIFDHIRDIIEIITDFKLNILTDKTKDFSHTRV